MFMRGGDKMGVLLYNVKVRYFHPTFRPQKRIDSPLVSHVSDYVETRLFSSWFEVLITRLINVEVIFYPLLATL